MGFSLLIGSVVGVVVVVFMMLRMKPRALYKLGRYFAIMLIPSFALCSLKQWSVKTFRDYYCRWNSLLNGVLLFLLSQKMTASASP